MRPLSIARAMKYCSSIANPASVSRAAAPRRKQSRPVLFRCNARVSALGLAGSASFLAAGGLAGSAAGCLGSLAAGFSAAGIAAAFRALASFTPMSVTLAAGCLAAGIAAAFRALGAILFAFFAIVLFFLYFL